ncbi:hypothetical protein L7F22_003534 [Adiantum nelumboides]|nr:hypothetical protein [Adiantum nelumboides]
MATWYADAKDDIGADVNKSVVEISNVQSEVLSGRQWSPASSHVANPWSGRLRKEVNPTSSITVSKNGKEKVDDGMRMPNVTARHDDVEALKLTYDGYMAKHFAFMTKVTQDVEPTFIEEAAENVKWQEALNEELDALYGNETWELVPLLKGKKPMGCRWVYKGPKITSSQLLHLAPKLRRKWMKMVSIKRHKLKVAGAIFGRNLEDILSVIDTHIKEQQVSNIYTDGRVQIYVRSEHVTHRLGFEVSRLAPFRAKMANNLKVHLGFFLETQVGGFRFHLGLEGDGRKGEGPKGQVYSLRQRGEFLSENFARWCKSEGIRRQLTTPYTPSQNGVVERKNRTIMEMARAMLAHASLPRSYWAEACNTAVYIQNRSPTHALQDMTPFQAYYGRKPRVSHFRIFGCSAFVHIPKEKRQKLDFKSRKLLFLGYSTESDAYRLYDPDTRTTTVSRDVVFDESFITSAEGSTAQPIPILPPPSLPDPPASPVITPSTSHPDHRSSRQMFPQIMPCQIPTLT